MSTHLKRTFCRENKDVCFQVLKASLATSNASLSSAGVVCGVRVTTSCVAYPSAYSHDPCYTAYRVENIKVLLSFTRDEFTADKVLDRRTVHRSPLPAPGIELGISVKRRSRVGTTGGRGGFLDTQHGHDSDLLVGRRGDEGQRGKV